MIGLRVDIDSVGDIEGTPKLIELLDKLDVKASFFVCFGPDYTGRNLLRYLARPHHIILVKPVRFGLRNLARGFARPFKLENYREQILEIEKHGHEVELHGYNHYSWIRGKINLTRAIESFRETMGREPRAFASPGFKVTPEFLLDIENIGLDYSSDYLGERPFYPVVDGRSLSTLQLPVNMKSLLELVMAGWSDCTIYRTITHNFTDDYFTFYVHPSFVVRYKYELLKDILKKAVKDGIDIRTFSEIAGSWDEDTPDL
jgi:hypothetical protein